jgi:hypothetical protein
VKFRDSDRTGSVVRLRHLLGLSVIPKELPIRVCWASLSRWVATVMQGIEVTQRGKCRGNNARALTAIPGGEDHFFLQQVSGLTNADYPPWCGDSVRSGNTRSFDLAWSPPFSGAAVTGYTVEVSGAYNGSFNTTDRTVAGTAPPGSYTISVRAGNSCGVGPPAPARTIVLP